MDSGLDNIKKFLLCRATKNADKNMTAIYPFRGSFYVPDADMNTFWDAYQDYVFSPENRIGLTELSGENMPLIVDVDISAPGTEVRELYTREQVKNVIRVYQEAIKSVVAQDNDKLYICFFLNKEPYIRDKKECRHGFHLHFPYAIFPKDFLKNYFVKKVSDLLKEKNVMWSHAKIDSACSYGATPWLLYGSSKDEKSEPYSLEYVYSRNMKTMTLRDCFDTAYLNNEDDDDDYFFNLPRFLSIRTKRMPCELSDSVLNEIIGNVANEQQLAAQKTATLVKEKRKLVTGDAIKHELDTAKKLISMLSPKRSEDRGDWLIVGWVLNYVGQQSDEAFEIWDQFSQISAAKYDKDVCTREWNAMSGRPDYSIGTLRYFAKTDNPDEYEKYRKNSQDILVKDALTSTHLTIAHLIRHIHENFVCTVIEKNIWYYYDDNHWERMDDAINIRTRMFNTVVSLLDEHYLTVMRQAQDEDFLSKLKGKIATVKTRLQTCSFRDAVIKELRYLYHDAKFNSCLDANPYIIGFQNGTYDLKTHTFRSSSPDDYIGKQLPIRYSTFHPKSNEIKKVEDFLQKIFPDPDLRQYFLDTMSRLFVGGNRQKKIYFFTGEGNNGKSVTLNLIKAVFGSMYLEMNSTIFSSSKIQIGKATPEMSQAKPPTRVVAIAEPDNDEVLNSGNIKKLTGGDTIFARDLFQKGSEVEQYVPMFHVIVATNKLPKIKHSMGDTALWDRIRVIEFESRFCRKDDPDLPSSFEEQMKVKKFETNIHFSDCLPQMAEAFAYYLLEWYRKNPRDDITEPPKVTNATRMYENKNDVYKHFIDNCLVESPDTSISMDAVWDAFKSWFQQNNTSFTIPDRDDLVKALGKMLGKKFVMGKCIRHYSLSTA